MKSPDWKTTAELLGLTAIVASLIFVGLELRQSQQIALAAQYQARTDAGREYFYESVANDYRIRDAAQLMENREWPEGFLSPEERQWMDEHPSTDWAQAAYWAHINLYGFDNYYFQFQSGFLSEEGWLALRSRLRALLKENPFARYEILHSGENYRKSFVVLARSLVAGGETE